jgi:hypothetical protein
MSRTEIALFESFLRHSDKYVEFGVGGTTVLAADNVKEWMICVDSSKDWIEKVDLECTRKKARPVFLHADIGPVGHWGLPIDPTTQPRWEVYHSEVWRTPRSSSADLYLIDGRFRVACFAQTVLHCLPYSVIGIHDFASRGRYQVVREIAREIASVENISFFLPLPGSRGRALEILDKYKEDPI